jgi:hypothetical protein
VTYNTPQQLLDRLQTLVEDAQTKQYDPRVDETFTQCLVCGVWESHDPTCPIPWMDTWLANGVEDDANVPGNVRLVEVMLAKMRPRWRVRSPRSRHKE